jgi:hypothetical protein
LVVAVRVDRVRTSSSTVVHHRAPTHTIAGYRQLLTAIDEQSKAVTAPARPLSSSSFMMIVPHPPRRRCCAVTTAAGY